MRKKEMTQKRWMRIFFIIYLTAITWIILLKMEFGLPDMGNVRSINLLPFSESAIVNGRIDFSEIYMNALAFLPFGVFCGMLFPETPFWKKCLPFMGLSLLFEMLQFILAIGRSDITDVINNTLGGIAGLVLYLIFCKIVRDRYKANKIVLAFASIGTIGMSALMALLVFINL